MLAFIFGGVLLAAIDWKVQRLPTRIVYFTLAGVGGGLVFASLVEWDWVPLATAVAGGVLFANVFFLIWLFTTKYAGMKVLGLGDVRLAAVLGLLLGWYGLHVRAVRRDRRSSPCGGDSDRHVRPRAQAAAELFVRPAADRRRPGGRAVTGVATCCSDRCYASAPPSGERSVRLLRP